MVPHNGGFPSQVREGFAEARHREKGTKRNEVRRARNQSRELSTNSSFPTGNPAVVDDRVRRPVALRPHLSMGLPLSAAIACQEDEQSFKLSRHADARSLGVASQRQARKILEQAFVNR